MIRRHSFPFPPRCPRTMAAASQERVDGLATKHAADAAKSKATELKEWITKGPLALKVLAFGANLAALIVVTLNLFGSTFSLKWIISVQ